MPGGDGCEVGIRQLNGCVENGAKSIWGRRFYSPSRPKRDHTHLQWPPISVAVDPIADGQTGVTGKTETGSGSHRHLGFPLQRKPEIKIQKKSKKIWDFQILLVHLFTCSDHLKVPVPQLRGPERTLSHDGVPRGPAR